MAYWLVKQEPETYSFDRFAKEQTVVWDGVRNHQAKRHLSEMKAGDQVLYYHTGKERSIVGIAHVAREAYPDPSAGSGDWVAVDLRAERRLERPVPLSEIKADAVLSDMALVRQGRLSVMPVKTSEWQRILALAGRQAPAMNP